MSHFRHLTPLRESKTRATGSLPAGQYGILAGTLDHLTLNPHDGPRPDDNHVYLWLNVNHGVQGGRYECAFNTESTDTSEVQYCVHEEEINVSEIPTPGFWSAEMSYVKLGLKQADFAAIENGELRSLIYHYAEEAQIIAAYGITYTEGNGIHDIHMNSGENKGTKHENLRNQDGALAFYFRHETGPSRRAWVFIKFATQTL